MYSPFCPPLSSSSTTLFSLFILTYALLSQFVNPNPANLLLLDATVPLCFVLHRSLPTTLPGLAYVPQFFKSLLNALPVTLLDSPSSSSPNMSSTSKRSKGSRSLTSDDETSPTPPPPSPSNIKKEVTVRHECKVSLLEKANIKLTNNQRERIEATPFKYLLYFNDRAVKISGNLLRELALRWDERRCGFRVVGKIIPFTPLDVCLALGLRIVGEKVQCENEANGIFGNEKVDPNTIYNKLQNLTADNDVDEFCRLYIALGFAEFYFPNSNRYNREVNGPWFSVLDDLNSLHKYSWGGAVYEYLVRGLTDTGNKLVNETVAVQTHMTGCVAVLQVWALEHVFPHTATVSDMSFPRVLKWAGAKLGNADLAHSFQKNLTVDEVCATQDELEIVEVREALQFAGSGNGNWSHGSVNASLKKIMDENEILKKQNALLDARITALAEEIKILKGESGGVDDPNNEEFREEPHEMPFREEPHETPCKSDSENAVQSSLWLQTTNDENDDQPIQVVVAGEGEGSKVAEDKAEKSSNMYKRRKNNPRKRTTGEKMRSPYIETRTRKRKKQDETKNL